MDEADKFEAMGRMRISHSPEALSLHPSHFLGTPFTHGKKSLLPENYAGSRREFQKYIGILTFPFR